MKNYIQLKLLSRSENESFARVAVASFISQLDPTIEEINDIKTVVSEAVTNSIIHGYDDKSDEIIIITVTLDGSKVEIIIEDKGKGISDIDKALQPLYTTKPELERSGMGFTIMENMMDNIEIESIVGQGTKVRMIKQLNLTKDLN